MTRKKFTIYLDEIELSEIEGKAKALNLSTSSFLRSIAKTGEIKTLPVINSKQYGELSRLSSNLNQFMHAVNSGKLQTVNTKGIIQMQNTLNDIRKTLIGEKVNDREAN